MKTNQESWKTIILKKQRQLWLTPNNCIISDDKVIAHISPHRHYRRWCTYFKPVHFLAWRTQNFGPALTTHLQLHRLHPDLVNKRFPWFLHLQLSNIAVKRSCSRVKLTSIPLWLLPYPCHCRILPPCAEIALEFMPSTCSHCSAIWSHGALNPSLFTTLIDREYLIWFGEKFVSLWEVIMMANRVRWEIKNQN